MRTVWIGIALIAALLAVSSGYFSQKEIAQARQQQAVVLEQNVQLQSKVAQLTGELAARRQFIDEVQQSIQDIDGVIALQDLEKYIPPALYERIRPSVERLKAMRQGGTDAQGVVPAPMLQGHST